MTKVVDHTDTVSDNSYPMNKAPIPTKGKGGANHFEVVVDDRGVTVETESVREAVQEFLEIRLSEEVLEKLPIEEITQAIIEALENSADSGSNIITQVTKDGQGLVFENEQGLATSVHVTIEYLSLTEEELKQKAASEGFTAHSVLTRPIRRLNPWPPSLKRLKAPLNFQMKIGQKLRNC